MAAEPSGSVGILNVGAGDTKLSFDPANPAERIRAARIVKDMLRRGYALMVEVERDGVKSFERAYDFDEGRCEYLIADLDTDAARAADRLEVRALEDAAEGDETLIGAGKPEPAAEPEPKRGRGRPKKIAAEGTRAVALSRSAGG